MLAIQEYIRKHGLEKTISDFNLKSREYENKVLLKYDQLSSPTQMAKPEMQDARGLILEKGTWKVLSLAFRKFFNADESNAHKIDWNTAHVLEKLDGTLIQLYWDEHKGKWFAGTTGTAEGEGQVNNKMGTTFNDLFFQTVKEKYNFDLNQLNKDCCFIFELTTPYNIVVKPHGESSATLLTIRNLKTLKECDYDELQNHASVLRVPVVKRYDLNAKNAGSLSKSLENAVWTDEGYVVVDANFKRVKIKNPAYVAVHHMKGKTAEHNIMIIIKTNEIEEFGATFPDRKQELYKLKANFDVLVEKLHLGWEALQTRKPKNITPAEKKKYAAAVFEIAEKYDLKPFTGLYFGLNDGKITDINDYIRNYDDKLLYKLL